MGIGPTENYVLKYYARPDDEARGTKPKGQLPMDGSEVLEDAGKSKKDQNHAFQIKVPGRTELFEVTAESAQHKDMWMKTLKYVISVASRRGMIMRQRLGSSELAEDYVVEEDEIPAPPPRREGKHVPAMRLEVEVDTIPPGTAERSAFMNSFQDDVSRALGDGQGVTCKVQDIKPAAGMDWLTVVTFTLESSFADPQPLHERLESMVADPNSDLYVGLVTCRTDPSYLAIVSEGLEGARIDVHPTKRAIATPVPRVKTVLEKYMHLTLPPSAHDASKFHVYLKHGDSEKTFTLWVPNPRTLPRQSCVLWPYEVKDCLGISGTVRDMWLTPTGLRPTGVKGSAHASSLPFQPSAKHGGMPIVDTAAMRQGMTYEVIFEDNTMRALDSLSEEQLEEIEENFNKYDENGDQNIDREEVKKACKDRTDKSKEAIDLQFEKAIENAKSQQEINKIIDQKKEHYQKVDEAEAALLDMFRKADTDGDGSISYNEFALAEAWWMNSTLNPTKVSLF
ncbi:hypothetical protein TeGR_g953 [Tetraparma gracilis]|uniref:Calmodulin n=1 Tax=Tetraparma gracilis TaxID=2962635 RepID=A0ABQ6MJA3_9STRA|nr:hypothetical protein TeGR_g953 [Tetraparma gracilis]